MKKETIYKTVAIGLGGVAALIGKTFYDRKHEEKIRLMRESIEKDAEKAAKPLDDAIERFGEMVKEDHENLEKRKRWLDEHRLKNHQEES